ncbi:hypothetical protein [Streptomyces sp. ODS28]
MDTLALAVRALLGGLERPQAEAVDEERTVRGAQRAHELLRTHGL